MAGLLGVVVMILLNHVILINNFFYVFGSLQQSNSMAQRTATQSVYVSRIQTSLMIFGLFVFVSWDL